MTITYCVLFSAYGEVDDKNSVRTGLLAGNRTLFCEFSYVNEIRNKFVTF